MGGRVLLSDRDLAKELAEGRLRLSPYDPEMLQPSSIDVRLDRFFRVFDNTKYTHIDPSIRQDELTSLVEQEGTTRSCCTRVSSSSGPRTSWSRCRTTWLGGWRGSRRSGGSGC
ncbi:hypothetical protein GCM10029964_121470 [Kibdelosporangium lantanae]